MATDTHHDQTHSTVSQLLSLSLFSRLSSCHSRVLTLGHKRGVGDGEGAHLLPLVKVQRFTPFLPFLCLFFPLFFFVSLAAAAAAAAASQTQAANPESVLTPLARPCTASVWSSAESQQQQRRERESSEERR